MVTMDSYSSYGSSCFCFAESEGLFVDVAFVNKLLESHFAPCPS